MLSVVNLIILVTAKIATGAAAFIESLSTIATLLAVVHGVVVVILVTRGQSYQNLWITEKENIYRSIFSINISP